MSPRPLDEEALTRALRALAEAEGRSDTPSRVEAAVMARWDAAHAPRGRSTARRLVRSVGALAAGVTLVGAVTLDRELASGPIILPHPPALSFGSPRALVTSEMPPIAAARPRRAVASATERSTEEPRSALVLVGQPIGESEVLHVVRMRVTRASLRVFGVSNASPAEIVDIDVVVGEDGVARGVRVPL